MAVGVGKKYLGETLKNQRRTRLSGWQNIYLSAGWLAAHVSSFVHCLGVNAAELADIVQRNGWMDLPTSYSTSNLPPIDS